MPDHAFRPVPRRRLDVRAVPGGRLPGLHPPRRGRPLHRRLHRENDDVGLRERPAGDGVLQERRAAVIAEETKSKKSDPPPVHCAALTTILDMAPPTANRLTTEDLYRRH